MTNQLADPSQTERRIQAFVAAGLDDFRIRAWTIIRGSHLRTGPEYVVPLRALLAQHRMVATLLTEENLSDSRVSTGQQHGTDDVRGDRVAQKKQQTHPG